MQQEINNHNKAKEENFYKQSKERLKQSNGNNKGNLHPIIAVMILNIIIIIVFKFLQIIGE